MVIGINFHTAPVGTRERFWIAPAKRREILTFLSAQEGIEEAFVLVTCKRTEFLLWANDATLAANSVLRLLSSQYSLQLCQWEHFYRLLGEDALVHVFRVASGLDSMMCGDPEAALYLKQAWQEAQQAKGAGRYLDSVLQKAFEVSDSLRQQAILEEPAVSVASVAIETANEILDSLQNRRIVLIGAGKLGTLAAELVANQGSVCLRILDRDFERALELSHKCGGTAVPCEDLAEEIGRADLVISCAAVPTPLLNEAQVGAIVDDRKAQLLCIIDLGLPRNIAADVRDLDGVFLYDLDDIRNTLLQRGTGQSAVLVAENMLLQEAKHFHRQLSREHALPMIVAVRERLDHLCRAELDSFQQERGPFPREQDRLLGELTVRIAQALATSLVHEIKETPKKSEQQMSAAIQRLFHLDVQEEMAGTR